MCPLFTCVQSFVQKNCHFQFFLSSLSPPLSNSDRYYTSLCNFLRQRKQTRCLTLNHQTTIQRRISISSFFYITACHFFFLLFLSLLQKRHAPRRNVQVCDACVEERRKVEVCMLERVISSQHFFLCITKRLAIEAIVATSGNSQSSRLENRYIDLSPLSFALNLNSKRNEGKKITARKEEKKGK